MSGSTPSSQSLASAPGARRKPHTPPAQPVGGPGSVHGGGPGRISGRAAPHHAGGRAAPTAQQWQLLWGRAAIQVGATDGPSQHGEEGNWGGLEWSGVDGSMNGGREGVIRHAPKYLRPICVSLPWQWVWRAFTIKLQNYIKMRTAVCLLLWRVINVMRLPKVFAVL